MFLSRFPLPSIHQVLEAGSHETLPRRPSVITVLEHDQIDLSPVQPPSSTLLTANIGYIPHTSHLMKTIDLRDAEPIAKDDEEQLSFIVRFPNEEQLENDADVDIDAQTIFKEKRPSTSRGLRHDSERGLGSSVANSPAKPDFPLLILVIRKVLPGKVAEAILRRTN